MNRTCFWVAVALATTGAVGCAKQGESGAAGSAKAESHIAELTLDEVDAKIAEAKAGKAKVAIIDANSAERYAESHLPTARWVDHSKLQASDLPGDKDTTLVFYCANEH